MQISLDPQGKYLLEGISGSTIMVILEALGEWGPYKRVNPVVGEFERAVVASCEMKQKIVAEAAAKKKRSHKKAPPIEAKARGNGVAAQ